MERIPVPEGYRRIPAPEESFAHWLRSLPLKPEGAPVRLFNGREKANQGAHWAVVDLDVGSRDLQQCADAVIRLRAEYLYANARYDDIHFHFTSGDRADFFKWAQGTRPVVEGNRVRWMASEAADRSYTSFRKYLDVVFTYAGTRSLKKETRAVADRREIAIGDILIQGGSPGHAVLVVDLAAHEKTGAKLLLLAQSYMPAQDIHVLRNPADERLSPWYSVDDDSSIRTPEWTFEWKDLRRFE